MPFGFVGTIPEANIEKAASECGAYVLDFNNFLILIKLLKILPLLKNSIPKGTYKNNDKNIVLLDL